MPHDNSNVLRLNRPGIFRSAFVRGALEQGATTTRHSFTDLEDTNALSTASFRYDAAGSGMRSTQQLRVDWSLFENHTFFNSAVVNTNVAFDNIINRYPFDGSRKEVEAFFDGLTGFEKWVYDQFPKSRGYLKFENGSFVTVQDTAGTTITALSKDLSAQSKLDPGTDSFTTEFQIYVPTVANDNQIILQKLSGTTMGYTIGLIGDGSTTNVSVLMAVSSGSSQLSVSGTIEKGVWQHVVATYDRSAAEHKLLLYNDELLLATSSHVEMGQIDFRLSSLFIGSGSAMSTPTGSYVPGATLSASLDELRIFHDVRTPLQQRSYAKKNIFAQPTLKLYLKFNEPSGTLVEPSTSSRNRLTLDSSGNSLHGVLNESTFDYALRNTGTLGSPMTYEKLDLNPVLWPGFNHVDELNETLLISASNYDDVNPNIITKLVPKHYFDEGRVLEGFEDVNGTIIDAYGVGDGAPREGELGSAQLLSSLLYVIAKHFDEVKIFLDAFGKVLFTNYDDFDTTPDQVLNFAANYNGFDLPGYFTNATFDQFINAENIRPEFGNAEQSLSYVQNQLWRRLLTNLGEIVRSRGTIHSIKSFIRTIGIDPDQNFRIREFGGPRNRRLGTSRENKTYVSTLLSMSGSSSAIKSNILSGSRVEPGYPLASAAATDGIFTSGSWTMEAFYKFPLGESYASSASLGRLCVTGSSALPSILFNVIATSSSLDPVSSSLVLYGHPASGTVGNTLTMWLSGVNLYDGGQWHVAWGRHRHDDPIALLESDVTSSYFLRAVRQESGQLYEQRSTASYFLESTTNNHAIDAQQVGQVFFAVGSQTVESLGYLSDAAMTTTTFTGRLGHVRIWSKGLLATETLEHARNYTSLGVIDPNINFNFVTARSGSFERLRIDMSTDQFVTSSDASGGIRLLDFSQNVMHMTGSGFAASTKIIMPETFAYSIVSPKFDEAVTSNKVRIRGMISQDNVERYGGLVGPAYEVPASEVPEDDPRFSIDFSTVDALNEDIIKIFATFDAMDDAIGQPQSMYAADYDGLYVMRDVYFNRLTDKLNLRIFFEFFRWFDSSVGMFIEQLVPRKTRYLGTNFVIEPHMLERSKYQHQTEDAYVGQDNRTNEKSTILLQLIVGDVRRY